MSPGGIASTRVARDSRQIDQGQTGDRIPPHDDALEVSIHK